ncbi:MAG: hypothetical protein AAF721_05580, partial [Myxococcota bacterium]
MPDFEYGVDDLHRASDEQLRQRALDDLPRVALWLLRDARDAEVLLSRLADYAPALERIVTAPSGARRCCGCFRTSRRSRTSCTSNGFVPPSRRS